MKCVATSLPDSSWLKDAKGIQNGVLFFAAGVFCYFEESEVKGLLLRLERSFPGGEIVFDTVPAISLPLTNRIPKEAGLANVPLKWASMTPEPSPNGSRASRCSKTTLSPHDSNTETS